MRLLLDAHTFLWFSLASPKLSLRARMLIEDSANEKLLSIASPWEAGIKVSTGKLTLAKPVDVFFDEQMQRNDVTLLSITLVHVARASTLPFHHRDPFDRMLVAQSLVEGIPVISADPALDAYGVTRLWQLVF